MTVETFDLPDVGEGVAEGELLRWLVDPGDEVRADEPLAEVETDKAVVDLPSPYDGTVRELHVAEGEIVPVGTTIVSIETDGEGSDADADADAPTPAGRPIAPPRTRRLARELGVDLDAVEGSGPKGRVTDADVRAASEAGGASEGEETPAPRSLASDTTSVMREGGRRAATHRESAETVEDAAEAVGETTRDRTLAAPATRRLADELGVDLDAVPTDRDRDGTAFVTPAMVHAYAERQRTAGSASDVDEAGAGESAADEAAADGKTTADSATESTPEPAPTAGDVEPGDRIPYRGIRRSIGERMEQATSAVPHATHTDEVDVTALVETKADLDGYAAAAGVDLTYLPFVMLAVTRALAEFPRVNASLDEDAGEIVCHDAYNLGVATATDAGLLVPVVEDVDEKGLLELARATATKVSRARDGSIAREEMQGGTFTVTNIGVIGGAYATPIVNHPEVAILALGEIKERPRVVDGDVVARQTLPLSLSVDHRVVDGAVAARFTNRVMELLASPARLLVDG
ncbi:MAG: dihydrolipoamide acetyltransferase family protein [Haloplanus sp.]